MSQYLVCMHDESLIEITEEGREARVKWLLARSCSGERVRRRDRCKESSAKSSDRASVGLPGGCVGGAVPPILNGQLCSRGIWRIVRSLPRPGVPANSRYTVVRQYDSTVSREVVVSSLVACARVVWGRYWYSNAALGPWCVSGFTTERANDRAVERPNDRSNAPASSLSHLVASLVVLSAS